MNLASRVAGAAGPGEVIVTEAIVRSALGEGLQFEPMGDASLKGFAEPVPVFRIRPPGST